jgi:hypothetical protein
MSRKKIIIYLYNSLKDPVIQSNIYLYLIDAAKEEKYDFAIISFEQDEFRYSKTELESLLKEFKNLHIQWYRLKWNSGSFKFLKKTWDLGSSFFLVFYLRFFKGYNCIISLNSIAGSFAYILKKCFFLRLFLYQYEPHSEYALDAKFWSRKTLSFKILNKLEYWSGKDADIISSGTYHMLNRLKSWNTRATVYKIPSVANDTKFKFSEEKRKQIRSSYAIREDQKIFIYPGKFGDLYFNEELIDLFHGYHELDKDIFFMVLTLSPIDKVQKMFEQRGIPKEYYTITKVPYSEMDSYLSASDLGIVSVPPLPSKKFCSNIKVGEFLCNGLPYLICNGVSEDDEYALNQNVGITVDYFSKQDAIISYPRVKLLLSENKEILRNRCRQAGLDYRSFQKLNPIFKQALETL